MSYILDALRKSEEKRSSLSLPATTGHHNQAQDKKGHRIQWLFIALFIAAGSGWFMTRPLQPETMPTTASHNSSAEAKTIVGEAITRKPQPELLKATAPQTTEPAEQPEQIQIQKPHVPQAKIAPEYATPVIPEQKTAQPDSTRPEQTPTPPSQLTVDQVPVVATANIPDRSKLPVEQQNSARPELTSIPPSLLTDDHEPAAATAHIRDRSQLPLKQQQVLPAISIAGHIYDENPSGRMVVINNKLRREKQRISDGLTLEEITADGVILNHRGTIFRMGVFD